MHKDTQRNLKLLFYWQIKINTLKENIYILCTIDPSFKSIIFLYKKIHILKWLWFQCSFWSFWLKSSYFKSQCIKPEEKTPFQITANKTDTVYNKHNVLCMYFASLKSSHTFPIDGRLKHIKINKIKKSSWASLVATINLFFFRKLEFSINNEHDYWHYDTQRTDHEVCNAQKLILASHPGHVAENYLLCSIKAQNRIIWEENVKGCDKNVLHLLLSDPLYRIQYIHIQSAIL